MGFLAGITCSLEGVPAVVGDWDIVTSGCGGEFRKEWLCEPQKMWGGGCMGRQGRGRLQLVICYSTRNESEV